VTGHEGCRQLLVDRMASLGCEIVASCAPPLFDTVWTERFTCPHGTTYWVEPTPEQRIQWERDDIP
jgi:hypothetical protein